MTAGPARSNCLFWALGKLWREGGYLAMRRSRACPCMVPHFFWSPDLVRWTSYKPIRPERGWVVLIDKWWFRGHVVEGDEA